MPSRPMIPTSTLGLFVRLQVRLDAAWYTKRGNPYLFCKGCDTTTPEISVRGHGKRCTMKGLQAEIAHYQRLLKAATVPA